MHAYEISLCNLCVLVLFLVAIVGQVRVPKQLVVVGDSSCIPNSVAEAGLRLPLGKLSFLSFDSEKLHPSCPGVLNYTYMLM
jgi:hypothetical protein